MAVDKIKIEVGSVTVGDDPSQAEICKEWFVYALSNEYVQYNI